ncbi:DNA-binding transcriptional regulator, LysR family [Allopseudospirillum japonicum]|uniref:DNA-binding transcriptional regulator, LysR family n=1 Tax=Allopseudospirillum japonicum TaxID=64971 RepID=A0A1H6RTL6_9GAMM|nr:LysR family transcriptional regulator [Allopseudospirillum japonicum]SEI55887.1 DNA-binding transcriptional regulator, LysR family [Allopseudospirillum japonicum]
MFSTTYLKTFLTLVETGSFTQTARKLEMTQPGVSQHIRKLESYFSLPLLDRRGKRFELTEAGRQVYDYGVRLFAEHDQFCHALEQDTPNRGELRIASNASFGLLFYPYLLGYQQKHSGIKVNYLFSAANEITRDLLAGRFDVGICNEVIKHPDLRYTPYLEEPLILVVPADFQGTHLQDLAGLGLINHPEGGQQASRILKANFPDEFRTLSTLPQRGYINQLHLVLDGVARGLGFAVLPRSVWEASPWQQQTREWQLAQPVWESIYLMSRASGDFPARYRDLFDEYRSWRQGLVAPIHPANTPAN